MRHTPTLKLSTRLVAFVTMIVVSAMFILFVGGVFTLKKIGGQYVDQNLQRITSIIDDELVKEQDFDEVRHWLPKLLQSSNVVELTLSSPVGVIYSFKDTELQKQQQDNPSLYKKSYPLQKHDGYFAEYHALPPYENTSYSFEAFFSLSLAILLVVFFLIKGVHWLKLQLYGSELLEERGRMILAGNVEACAKGDEREWPYTASESLDILIEELNDARQERSRFDTFIRSHAFLDQLTGAANRVLFDSRLESALQEAGASGGVFVIGIHGWDLLTEETDKNTYEPFLVAVGQVINNLIQKYPNAVFARYYDSQFALLIPHQSEKEMSQLANQCINHLEKLAPPLPLENNNWCHLGLSYFSQGESRSRIIGEAESALKTALLERSSGWAKYEKKVDRRFEYRGGVRWRNLFDSILAENKLYVFAQTCYLIEGSDKKNQHFELFSRIKDETGAMVKASRFLNAIQQVGYERKLDQLMLKMVFEHLKLSETKDNYSINLFTEPFKKKQYCRWLRYELLQLTKGSRQKLSFEFIEGALIRDLDFMKPVIKMLSGLGCTVIVNQVGRTIVSTHYVKDLPITYLKLHRSLVKQIDRKNENQLFIRSLIGACVDTPSSVIAVGVETQKEWDVLARLGVMGGQGRLFEEETQLLPNTEATVQIKPGRRNRWRK